MGSGLYTRNGLLMAFIFLILLSGEADIILQNLHKVPIEVCSNSASSPIILQPNGNTSILKPYGLLSFWSCNAGNSECINAQNINATVAELNIGDDSNSYRLSAEYGYNFALRIMPLSSASCPTVTCKANLDDCPNELQILDSIGAVVACKPPDCSESPQLCIDYSSLVADSHCQTPGSSYGPSSISSTCPVSIDLVVSFINN